MSDNTNAALSLAEMLRKTEAQPATVDTFRSFLQETGITTALARDSSNVLVILAGELTELVEKFGLDTDKFPDAAVSIARIQASLAGSAAILAEIADAAELSGAASSTASSEVPTVDSGAAEDSATYGEG